MKYLDDYATKYRNVKMERKDGILLVQLHSDGGELVWEESAHRELPYAFYDLSADPENLVVILTGTGDNFIDTENRSSWGKGGVDVRERIFHEAKLLIRAVLDIPVPVIAAINGPARVHAEIPLMSDLVLAAEHTFFQDKVHFTTGGVPGDGVHVLWPMWLGINRGRSFLLTAEKLAVAEAKTLGVVAEVLPADKLLDRAWEHAREMIRRDRLTLRYTRTALTLGIRRALNADFDEGLALEFMQRAYFVDKGYPGLKDPV